MKELERSLGVLAVIALSMGAMIGSGIFVLPGLAAALTGSSVWLAYLLAGFCALPAAACKAELATAMPTSGGTYVFVDRIFGPLAGTMAGVALWLSALLKSAFALIGIGTYLVTVTYLAIRPVALGILVGIVLLNTVGVRALSRAQFAILGLAITSLIALTTASCFGVEQVGEPTHIEHGLNGLLSATALVFVSYNGVTKIAAIGEEVKNPRRNIPVGIFASLALAMGLYAWVAFVLVRTVPGSALATDLHPIHLLGTKVGGSWLGTAMSVIAIITMASMANVGLLAASRYPFAMSRDRLLPPLLSHVSSRFNTPIVTIAITGIGMGIAVAFLDITLLAKIASAMVIGLFITVNSVVVVFRESRVHWYQPAFRAPFYPWLQLFGVLSGLFLLAMLGVNSLVAIVTVSTLGLALYSAYGRRRTARHGVVRLRLRRPELGSQPLVDTTATPIAGNAAVIVSLFGNERSPETLTEVGRALANVAPLKVVHFTEVPEQVFLGALVEDEAVVRSLQRRIQALAQEHGSNVDFHAIASRDIARAALEVTHKAGCDWLVMEWRGKRRRTLLPYNPLGRLINHLDVNLALYRDKGIRRIREIIAYAEPGPHDALVVSTADHLAQIVGANLVLVRFVGDAASATEVQAEADYLGQLRALCDGPCRELLLRGESFVQSLTTATAAFDLLVTSAPDVTFLNMLFITRNERIALGAACSVLTLKTPRIRTHESVERHRQSVPPSVCHLPDYIQSDTVGAKLAIHRKDALFQHFAEVFERHLENTSTAQIVEALWDRERTQNTSVGHGVALPHATLPSAKRAMVGIFTTSQPIDYRGPDGTRIGVFFVTICPPSERHTHLLLLSKIAGLSLKTDLLERLRDATSNPEIVAAIHHCSANLDAKP